MLRLTVLVLLIALSLALFDSESEKQDSASEPLGIGDETVAESLIEDSASKPLGDETVTESLIEDSASKPLGIGDETVSESLIEDSEAAFIDKDIDEPFKQEAEEDSFIEEFEDESIDSESFTDPYKRSPDEYSFVGETEEEEMNDLDFDDIGMDEISDIEIENRPKLLQAHEHSFMAQKQGPPPGGPLPGGQPPGGQKLPQALPLMEQGGGAMKPGTATAPSLPKAGAGCKISPTAFNLFAVLSTSTLSVILVR